MDSLLIFFGLILVGWRIDVAAGRIAAVIAEALAVRDARAGWAFKLGYRVTKTKGSKWTGKVVGFYSTDLTPEGYAVESETEVGSVQIYPRQALETKHD